MSGNRIELYYDNIEKMFAMWEALLEAKYGVKQDFSGLVGDLHALNGGLGNLANAAEQLDKRAQLEEIERSMMDLKRQLVEAFLEDVRLAEHQVKYLWFMPNLRLALLEEELKYRRAQLAVVQEDKRRCEEVLAQIAAIQKMEDEMPWYRKPAYWSAIAYQEFANKWHSWDEDEYGGWKKAGVITGAALLVAAILFLSGGTAAAAGAGAAGTAGAGGTAAVAGTIGTASLKSALIFGGIGATVSGVSTAVQGGSGKEIAINTATGGFFGALGGAGFGAGFFLQSGRIIWASGAGTSALSTAFSAWRSDRKIDVKLAAEIYTRAVIGGTLDLAFGKAFSGVRTAVKPTPFTEMKELESISINVSPEVAKTLNSGTGSWDVLTWGGNKIQTIKYSGELDSRIRAYLEETQKVKLPEKLTIINDFTHGEESLRQTIQLPRGIWVERESDILAGVHLYPKLERVFSLWDNFYFNVGRTATLPSVGDASTRWVIDKDKWGIITDTFYIPEVKQSKKSP